MTSKCNKEILNKFMPIGSSFGRRIADIFLSFCGSRESVYTFHISVCLAFSFWPAVRVSVETDIYISLGIKDKFSVYKSFDLSI